MLSILQKSSAVPAQHFTQPATPRVPPVLCDCWNIRLPTFLKHLTTHISRFLFHKERISFISEAENVSFQELQEGQVKGAGLQEGFPGCEPWATFLCGGSIQTPCQRDLWWLWVVFHTPRWPWHTGDTRSTSPQQERQAGPRCCCRPVHPESPGEFKNFRGMWCTSEILKWNIPSFHQAPTPRVVSSSCCTGLPEAQQVLLPNIPNTRHGSFSTGYIQGF